MSFDNFSNEPSGSPGLPTRKLTGRIKIHPAGYGFVVPDDRLNPNGGAVAIGHPFGASGARYVLTLAIDLRVRQGRYGILGVCVGSGQGVAMVIESIPASA